MNLASDSQRVRWLLTVMIRIVELKKQEGEVRVESVLPGYKLWSRTNFAAVWMETK